MSKRPWSSNGDSQSITTPHPSKRHFEMVPNSQHNGQPLAQISRNIKACTIKCLMADTGPPCQRCHEKHLDCVVSKNLQTIIDEKSQLAESMLADIANLYGAVREMRGSMGLPDIPPLHITPASEQRSSGTSLSLAREEGYGPSCDNSPRLAPSDDRLPCVPIQSLYTLTKMRALRSPDGDEAKQPHGINDFISCGKLALPEAERLFSIYKDRLDGFIYSIGCRYQTLDELRRRSPMLSAATLTVAAMHDANANQAYGVCRNELRRLVERSMFQRQADRDYFRALSIASYWLSDLSWTLSGHAIRKAVECNIHNSYIQAIKDQSEDAADCARIWSILYICDQHLALLYNRPAIIQDDWSTQDWEAFLNCTFSTNQDERLMSQVELMGIMKNIRQLFGPNTGEAIPRTYVAQLTHYNRQLDQWVAKWTARLPEQHPGIGGFPRKGARLHYHFAQLYLYSHIFRGQVSPLPSYLLDSALAAINAAIAIMDSLLTDPDVSNGIIGMPSYLISMIAFTCIFVVKIAHKYKDDGLIQIGYVQGQITALVTYLRSIATGRWHLANLMIDGLEKLAKFEPSAEVGLERSESMGSSATINAINVFTPFPEYDGMVARVDGNPHPAIDTTFGLSPIYGFDLSWIDMEVYNATMQMCPVDEMH
ncbi:hypothetical protein B0I35DRAFT_480564 [Stachybotrys elegans]|uniref:Xylanolytic transcriptional activator regulatory domain-containing protein n=1 Tax=Stachybotrys elegans TaxID=80388 RepID=A0A8K0WR95_9HYPO|nr:hypothetical protein B0I35DRAFT_480564 [Stachybotrys elegans]